MTLMTGRELKARLESGEDAFNLSIEKWERIRDLLKERNLSYIEIRNYCYGNTCGLCEIHDHNCYGHDGALDCPLVSARFKCDNTYSPWHRFIRNPTWKNADKMVITLKEVKNCEF